MENKRNIGIGLGLGIAFMPLVFSWFTLRNGHSVLARALAFVWLGTSCLIFAFTGSAKPTNVHRQPAQAAAAPTSINQKTAPPQITIGQRFQLGKFAYTIDKVSATDFLGNKFTQKIASDGAVFVIIDYTIENLGKKTDVVMVDDFKIVDDGNRVFRASVEGNTTLALVRDSKDLMLTQLQPGIKKKSATVFEIPTTSAIEGTKLVIPEKGIFGSKKVEIQLPLLKE